jgi:hypothetical protein
MNVIRGWLGHVDIATTNRYGDISIRAKEAALRACDPPRVDGDPPPKRPAWRNDESLLAWLGSL